MGRVTMNPLRRLHPVPVIAGLVVTLLGAQLGNWQLRRADEKVRLRDRIEAAAAAPAVPLDTASPAEWRGVRLVGEWVPGGTILLDNRLHEGRPGYFVLTPLRLAGEGGVVLVSRGWIAAGADRSRSPEVAGGRGPANVEGVVRYPQAQPFTLAQQAGMGRLWQVLDLPAYRQAFGLPVAEFVVYQTTPADDGLVRDWPRPDAGIDRHRGYALQWYGLATAAVVMTWLYVARNWNRKESFSS